MDSFIIGVDEAGRGSVIGPLVVAVATCNRNDEKKLNKFGKKDSKQLTAKQREETFEALKKFCTFRWAEISAQDLNRLMPTMSLNDIEAKAMAGLIKNSAGDVMIDLPDRYGYVFANRMRSFGVTRFEAQHKADENYPIVAAASICAKVIRDKKITEIAGGIGAFGSGYPSDRYTLNALKDSEMRKKLTPFIRERWQTIENLKQTTLATFEGQDYDTIRAGVK